MESAAVTTSKPVQYESVARAHAQLRLERKSIKTKATMYERVLWMLKTSKTPVLRPDLLAHLGSAAHKAIALLLTKKQIKKRVLRDQNLVSIEYTLIERDFPYSPNELTELEARQVKVTGTRQGVKSKKLVLEMLRNAGGQPVKLPVLIEVFGKNAWNILRDLRREGLVKRRKTYTKGRLFEYMLEGVPWPTLEVTREEAVAARHKHDYQARKAKASTEGCATQTQKNAAENAYQSKLDMFEPWPFFSEKFVPYIKYMDAKMAKRYRRTAEHYGIKVPG